MMDGVQEAGLLGLPQLGRVPILALGGRTNLEGLWLGQVQKGMYRRQKANSFCPRRIITLNLLC